MKRIASSIGVMVLSALVVPTLCSQQIELRVIDARNGKPVKNECVNIWTGTERGQHLVAQTDNAGSAKLKLSDGNISAERVCKGWQQQALANPESDSLRLASDWHISCQSFRKAIPADTTTNPISLMPAYAIKTVLETGVSAANTCGRFRVQARPGELILFVRPATFLEDLRR
jgi:hypothetical protein